MTLGQPERAAELGDGALEALYEDAPCGYVSTTGDGLVIRVNATFLRWTGYALADVIGKPLTSLLSIGSRLFFETRFMSVLHLSGEVREVALSFLAADGTAMPALVNANTVPGESGRPAVIRTAIFDATGRQDYERDLLDARRLAEASEIRVRVLQDASATFVGAPTEQVLAEELARSARGAFAASVAEVHLLDGERVLHADASNVLQPEHVRAVTDAVIRSGTAITVSRKAPEAGKYPGLADALRGARMESLSVVPLMDEDSPLGVVMSYFGRERMFDEAEIELQLALARQAAQVLTRLRLQRELERLALYDQLTGLANRKLLHEQFEQILSETVRDGADMSLVFIDLDRFKAINDDYGHSAGDQLLADIAKRLLSAVRDHDIVGRFGGDEFVVLCQGADGDAARAIADRLREVLGESPSIHPGGGTITASIGIASFNGSSGLTMAMEDIFRAADEAMYRSKRGGKDSITSIDLQAGHEHL